ncbi:PKD domain-containing protein, partial [Pontibacter toksunensis]
GSGSTNPADGRPGVLYVGDVGYGLWEDLNVVTRAGMNFGWPLFEGLTPHNGYMSKKTYNAYAPNQLYNTGGCTQQYFYFQDLIKQETASGTASFTNPCNAAQAIPAGANTFLHSRPVIDWRHSTTGPSRTGIFNGETAAEVNIGAPGSPVSGPQFGGNSVVAGVFYTRNDFPKEFRNTFFFGDYTGKWIRNLTADAADKPTAVQDFISSGAVVVHMATHPAEGGIYYVNFPSEIRKITYRNRTPVAVVSSDKTYGESPLAVQFTGSNSYDPDGQNISYLWDFGDGTTSTLANPSHTFTSTTTAPTSFTVTLTVSDPPGTKDQKALTISLNNTPPHVTITSPLDNTKYPMTSESTYALKATVSDAEHSSSQLTYRWQSILHHEDHQHPEPASFSPESSISVSPLGCGAETYYYRVTLTVTDAAGLATTHEVKLVPDCNMSVTPIVREVWNNVTGTAVSSIPVNTAPSSTSQLTLFEAPSNTGENYGARVRAYVQAPITGEYTLWIASDQDSELWLSTDENPANKRKIASVSGLTNSQEWTKYTTQASSYISLQAGKKYYIEALHKESTGADHLAVGWQLPDGGMERPIPGYRLTPFAPPATNQPPVANAGPDKTITLPTSSVQLSGSATDSDGTISGYSWSQVSGPNTAT